jgi:hypothetical protein
METQRRKNQSRVDPVVLPLLDLAVTRYRAVQITQHGPDPEEARTTFKGVEEARSHALEAIEGAERVMRDELVEL